MTKQGWVRSGFLLVLSLCLAGCGGEEEEEAQGGRGGPPGGGQRRGGGQRPQAAIPVKAEQVVRGDMNSYVETYARLEAERQVSVLGRASGMLEELSAEEGDRVREGQILARIDKVQSSFRVRQAQTNFAEASANFKRFGVLHENKMVSQSEFETVRLQFENRKMALEEAELNLAYADVKAPVSGVITQRLVELGGLIGGNQELFVIADLEPLLVRIFIPERRMYQLHKGQRAKITAEALPDQSFEGVVRMISPEVDPESGTVKVTLEVPASGLLKPGMFTTVQIITERRPNTLTIPKKALVLETDGDDVYVIDQDKVRQAVVELGFVEGDRVEVVSGLEEGQYVVTVGHDGLKDGVAVRLVGTGQIPPADVEMEITSASPVAEAGSTTAKTGGKKWSGAGKPPGGRTDSTAAKAGGKKWSGAKGDSTAAKAGAGRPSGRGRPDSLQAKKKPQQKADS
ncbi:MAG: efflux RND transporter periplasmic adaptor subunit [Candidatus Latescibacteria bacterium]|nr:efflux RND transporter periplasmic adaptor subunit [Candidatus Latescibacterota bacterium]